MLKKYASKLIQKKELEKYLDNAKQELEELKARFRSMDETDSDYDSVIYNMMNLADEVEDLKERISIAWEDDEYDELNASDSWDNFISCFE